MTRIISIHSFRGGTGKSNIVGNIAALLARSGLRVGVVDTDIQSPGLHVLFGLALDEIQHTLNDYVWGSCSIEETAHDVTARLGANVTGRLYLLPSSMDSDQIARVLREGFDPRILVDGFHQVSADLHLDALIVDTHPGLNSETLLSMAVSDALAIILRPDAQDYQGTSVTLEVARRLDVPQIVLIMNKVPQVFDVATVQQRVEQTYDCDVAAVLSHSEEMMLLGSEDFFVVRYPHHPITAQLRQAAQRLLAD